MLAGSGRADVVTPAFTPLPGTLVPGGELPLQLTVPLLGPPTESLALTRPGVYEVLVNVNGVPSDGGRARLAAVRLLLPVLSVPGTDPATRLAGPRRLCRGATSPCSTPSSTRPGDCRPCPASRPS